MSTVFINGEVFTSRDDAKGKGYIAKYSEDRKSEVRLEPTYKNYAKAEKALIAMAMKQTQTVN